MEPKEKKQKLDTSEIIASPFLSKTHLKKKKKQKIRKPQVITSSSLSNNKDLVITCPSLANIDVGKAMKKQNDLAIFLTGLVISSVAKNTNFVFSPASINTVLTMVAASSSDEESRELRSFILSFLKSSSTDELNAVFREIASTVLVDGSKKGGPKIAVVNGVWMEKSLSINPSSKDLFKKFFKAAFAQVDFRSKAEEVCMEVNAWASSHTNGLIKDLLPLGSVTNLTDRIYGSALYFKGAWQDEFHKSMTRHKPFYLLSGTSVSVPFMSSSEDQYIEAYDGFKVLRLPYRQGRDDTNRNFSMYFYLPDKKGELDNLLERMTSTPGFLDSHIPENKVKVGKFRVPKFKIEFGFEASSVFSDFELDVSLYQKALIEIDEEGTEAAAVAAPHVRCKGCRFVKTLDFVADHPFVFLIREDQTGTVLFAGQIFDPSV
ncbi:Serpin superfamily [Arabidopsis thaliana x Arabidopsis arenosa]|uniref:Serpin superfamily n=1 Tax=Arabidopsis thaliana x Arabidopsis arenosa TaxID=1240361 RepID=A0A8T2BFM2_9BRAS|nr:Serpin superfamily [Arabidopsis thaliana x Arabidopsis arenosa]